VLDVDTRTAVLRLRAEGHGIRTIARVVGISRNAVRRILKSGRAEVPEIERSSKADDHADWIRELYAECKGNLVRVWEKLGDAGVEMAYSTLTGFCRRHEIGVKEKKPAGRYDFWPGEEMQHDTSPHDVVIGGKQRRMQCASVVLCFSRLMYVQVYPTFNRFYCKVFLTEAIQYFGGSAGRCMVDNTSVVIAHGTGRDAVPAPEMEAFSDRFGFKFKAHEKGDANRSARVERPFWFIENNFYPGRQFSDLEDLNRQAIDWCDKIKHRFMNKIRAVPAELYQLERPYLKPLPIHVPEVYELHKRIVDLEGYVSLNGNRYSVPAQLLGRRVDLRESKERVRIFDGHRVMAEHQRLPEYSHARSTLPEHRRRGLWRDNRGGKKLPELPEEKALRAAGGSLWELAQKLRERHGGRAAHPLRRLHRMYLDYPTDELQRTVADALRYGLMNLERIERMVLHNIAGDFFRIPTNDEEGGGENE